MFIYAPTAPEPRKLTASKAPVQPKDKSLPPIWIGTCGSGRHQCVPTHLRLTTLPSGGHGRISVRDGRAILAVIFLMRYGKALILNSPSPYRQGYSNPGKIHRKEGPIRRHKATTSPGCFPAMK